MKTEIKYNNLNVFSGICPTPSVEKNDEMILFHNRWAVKSNILLNGYITGACSHGSLDLINKQQALIRSFADDFKTLSILENGQTIYSAPYVTINSIRFDNNNYVRLLPFQISISAYQQNLFSGVYGITEPEHSLNWSEGEDGIVTINRTIAAKGFNTNGSDRSNNALSNATAYVQSLTGFHSSYFSECLPTFIKYNTSVIPCVRQIKESVDRLTAKYSIQETYTYDQKSNTSYILKYTTDFNYDDKEGIYNASIKGSIQGCQETDMATLRSVYKNLNLYNITNFEYKKSYNNVVDLNPEFLSESINENSNLKTIEFSKSWDSDPRGLVLFEYTINTSYSYVDDLRTVSIEGVISARNSQKVRWDRVLDYYASLNVFNIAQDFYINKGYPYQLVKLPESYTVNENKIEGTISINASYSDKIQPPAGFDDGDYSISITPSIKQIIPVPVLCGKYYLIDIGALKRSSISVNGNLDALSSSPKVSETRVFSNKLLLDYLPSSSSKRVLKDDKVTYVQQGQIFKYSFGRMETYMDKEFTI